MTEAAVLAAPDRRPWARAGLWLALLGPFFFVSYGAANWLAAQRAEVGSVVFGWEHRIPFVPWTIVPYWSIDAFYGLSLFVCANRAALDTHAKRLLTAQVVAVACFILVPLRFTFPRPEVAGVSGALFTILGSFDKPFNQAPSLHIALLVILWVLYRRAGPRWAEWPLHLWFALVGLSVLTTWQHHFIDMPTGALLGFFCLWLWPDGTDSPLAGARLAADPARRRLALRYLASAAMFVAAALWLRGLGWFLLWPAIALALVALNYAFFGPAGFGKRPDGRIGAGALGLLLPYTLAAWANSRLWTWAAPDPAAVADGVSIGRMPWPGEPAGFATVIDLCAELPGGSARADWHALPLLDLVAPDPAALRAAAARIETARARGKVLVCCALGYGRSAAAIAAWLVATGRAADTDAAIAALRRVRPRIAVGEAARQAIATAAAGR
jgi:hypothetical protein